FYLLVAVGLISTELLIVQFSVFWFLFFGLGALVTSLVAWIAPEISWFVSTLIFVASSLGVSAVLYPILRKWQNTPSPIAGNDAIGQRVEVIEAITTSKNGKVLWSGSEWPAEIEGEQEAFEKGDKAVIRRLEGIRLIVGK
ncbi:MAG: NfeD family protein, partial [Acidiferrobacterales bacterium]|nr:NfeD family protein [Acidiferrobacterales bacterium]